MFFTNGRGMLLAMKALKCKEVIRSRWLDDVLRRKGTCRKMLFSIKQINEEASCHTN